MGPSYSQRQMFRVNRVPEQLQNLVMEYKAHFNTLLIIGKLVLR
jgi:hypothetical protein